MADLAERYRSENGVRLIEISLRSVQQLFNSLDPAPFHQKDLDDEAEAYITGAVRELAIATPVKLVFHLPQSELGALEVRDLQATIQGYFGYRAEATRRDLRFMLYEGRRALAIGLAFLVACLAVHALFFRNRTATLDLIASEGLIIIGWVAMWRPLETFLYDWWPLRRRARVFDKLAGVPVEVRPISGSA